MAPSGVNNLSQPCISEKKSGWMKCLSKIFRPGDNREGGGSASGSGGRPPQQLLGDQENKYRPAPARSTDDRSRVQKEKEELDHAVALSLAEDLKRQNRYRRRTKNDEAISRELQDKMNLSPYPSLAPPRFHPDDYKYCSCCNRAIGSGNYLGSRGTYFHPECLRCCSCGCPITEHEFSFSGKYPYHKSCLKELTHPKCEVCHQFIPINRVGSLEYKYHPFWYQKYCPSHEYDNVARCCSCERLESRNARYISLGDGRSLCLECMETAIMDTGDCQPLYHSIRDYYEGMHMRIDQQIPMLLVERQALNEAVVGEKHGFHRTSETRGLCLSEGQTVSSIHRRPRIGGHRLVGMRTQPRRLIRGCEVTAILVLYGLPRLLTGSILVHELMHGWLRLSGYGDLNLEVEEGICQVLSYMWLESEVMPGFRSGPSTSAASSSSSSSSSYYSTSSKKGGRSFTERKLGEFFMYQMANDVSKIYGDGFRTANAAVNKYGLRRTLDHIRMTGSFPV